jgi:hypothetical protein
MNRLIILGSALLCLGPQAWAKKPELPAISTCYGRICLTGLRWRPPSIWGDHPNQSIEGVLVNQSTATLSFVHVTFAIKSGANLAATATALFSGVEIPPGGRWYFVADIPLESSLLFFLTRSEAVELSCTARIGSEHEDVRKTLPFEPLFSPFNRSERKAWEKIHGKRQR